MGFPGSSAGKESTCNAGDPGLISGSERSPGEGIGFLGLPGCSDGKESTCNAGDLGSIPGLGRFSWRRACQPTPVFLPENPHGQRSLVGYSPWGHKELDTTE